MDKIEVMLLNAPEVKSAEKMMVCAARLTQRGQAIQSLNDFVDLYHKGYMQDTVKNMANLPHPTIQKFAVINAVVVGASRRFLAQVTRHQNEVKFMSASLQYSNYSGKARFVVPYDILGTDQEDRYLAQCEASMKEYTRLIAAGIDNDTAGYTAPQSLRNVLIISATPYQWKHMISQRICRRNTLETRYVFLKLWQALYEESSALFSGCGPFCMHSAYHLCTEGKMSCGKAMLSTMEPEDILKADFPKLCG